MSNTRAGNLWGAFLLLLGLAVCVAWYLKDSTSPVLFVGIALAVFGGVIIDPAVFKQGARDLGEAAAPVADLLPIKIGRRATDPTVVKVVTPPPDSSDIPDLSGK